MARLALALTLATAACAPSAPPRRPPHSTTTTAVPAPTLPATTTTAPAPVTSSSVQAARPPSTVPPVVAEGAAPRDDAFWRRLADCECASGQCDGAHVSYFQFSGDTARKVGIDGSESYEEQRAAAQEWARRIHPNEGTRSGWPTCWAKAAA